MKKQIYIIISVASIVLFVALLAWLMPSQKNAANKAANSASKNSTSVNSGIYESISTSFNLTEQEIEERIKESQARRKFVTLDEDLLRAGVLNKQMFVLSNAEIVSINNPVPLTEDQKNDGRIFITNNPYTLEGKRIGDRIEFTVPGYSLKREAIIQKIDVDPQDDIISWSGYLDGGDINSEKFYITQTIKDNFTIGTINANGKAYSMLIKNGYGWVNDEANEAAILHAAEAEMGDIH